MKSDGVKQRKILATPEQNYFFCKPRRDQPLGLYGACALAGLILELDRRHVAMFDQETCFTYVELPPWWWALEWWPRWRGR